MMHRLLVLSLSTALAFGATTVRADRRINAPDDIAPSPRVPVRQGKPAWEILAGCPESVDRPDGHTPLETAAPSVNAAMKRSALYLDGDHLALAINRRNDGLADAPRHAIDGDEVARRMNRLNDGLDPVKSSSQLAQREEHGNQKPALSRSLADHEQAVFNGQRSETGTPATGSVNAPVRQLVPAGTPAVEHLRDQIHADASARRLPPLIYAAESLMGNLPFIAPTSAFSFLETGQGGAADGHWPRSSRLAGAGVDSTKNSQPIHLSLDPFSPCAELGESWHANQAGRATASHATSAFASLSAKEKKDQSRFNDLWVEGFLDGEEESGCERTPRAGERSGTSIPTTAVPTASSPRSTISAVASGPALRFGDESCGESPWAADPCGPDCTESRSASGGFAAVSVSIVRPMSRAGERISSGAERILQESLQRIIKLSAAKRMRQARLAAPYRGL